MEIEFLDRRQNNSLLCKLYASPDETITKIMENAERIAPLSTGSFFTIYIHHTKVNLEKLLSEIIEDFGLENEEKIKFHFIGSGNSSYAIPLIVKHQKKIGVQKGKRYTGIFQKNIKKVVMVDFKLNDMDIRNLMALQWDFHVDKIDIDGKPVQNRSILARMHVRETSSITITGIEHVC